MGGFFCKSGQIFGQIGEIIGNDKILCLNLAQNVGIEEEKLLFISPGNPKKGGRGNLPQYRSEPDVESSSWVRRGRECGPPQVEKGVLISLLSCFFLPTGYGPVKERGECSPLPGQIFF
jgi:hypothetical protein